VIRKPNSKDFESSINPIAVDEEVKSRSYLLARPLKYRTCSFIVLFEATWFSR